MTFLSILVWVIAALVAAILLIAGYFAHATRRIAVEAERRVPAAGKFVDVDGNRIHYVDQGEGRPIVFVHGLGAQLLQFRHPLFDRLDGYRLIALDRPGAGYSVRARGASARLTEQARVVRRFIEVMGLERPLLVGHSLGGMVALATALDHPQSISGIALLAPLTRYQDSVPPEFRALYMPSPLKRWLMANTLAIPTAMKHAPQTLAFIFAPQAPDLDYLIQGGGWVGLRPGHFYGAVSDFTAIKDDLPALEKRYGEIAMPAGILFGSKDRVLDYARHGLGMEGAIPGLEIEILEGIGHMPHYAATDRVVAFIRRIAARAFAGQPAQTFREHIGGRPVSSPEEEKAMPGVNREKIPYDSIHRGETGARKYPARPGLSNVQDGISLGGTETGDPKDSPPKDGYSLTEPVPETKEKTRKSGGRGGKPT